MPNYSNTSQHVVISAEPDETPAERYDRDVAQQGTMTVPEPGIPDDRADRELHQQDVERSSRRYVDFDSGESATGHDHAQKDALVAAAKEDHSNDSLYIPAEPA